VFIKRIVEAARWILIASGLAGIVALYHHFPRANTTTVSLTLLLFVLLFAGSWGLRYAIGASLAAALLFDCYFLPPVGTLTINDTQNWIALFAFLGTALYASHLASRIREESHEADSRRLESEMLYRLGRQLLQPENVAQLLNFIPSSVANAFNSPAVTLYLADGDRIYLSDPKRISSPNVAWNPGDTPGSTGIELTRVEMVHDLREAMSHPVTTSTADGFPAVIPLRVGVRPTGVVLLEATSLSRETMEALSGLVSMSIERAEALEDSARSKAAKETERLRTVIDEESDRLNHLIEQAVEMAQLDANKVHLEMKPQSIAGLIYVAIEQSRSAQPARDIRVSLSSFLPNVLADKAWIEKVLVNLLSNAIKYSPPDQPIFVSADPQKEMLTISVADRGTGIDPLEQGMIFDKFYRGPRQRNQVSGTGMGLAICRAIVNAHGGAIGVTSQLNHGSVFTFTLPIARP
jgi:two-component system sensor histidine kinase KdpD